MKKEHQQTRIIAVAALAIGVLGLTTAFALLSAQLNITGTAQIKEANWQVGFGSDCLGGGISAASITKTGEATATIGATATTATFNVTFTAPNDSATVALPIKNCGTIDAKITSVDITNMSDLAADDISWTHKYSSTIDGTTSGDNVAVGDSLSAGVTKPTNFNLTWAGISPATQDGDEIGYTVTITYEQKNQ